MHASSIMRNLRQHIQTSVDVAESNHSLCLCPAITEPSGSLNGADQAEIVGRSRVSCVIN